MKAQRGCRGTALLILNIGPKRGWVVNATPRPLYIRETAAVPLQRRMGGHQEPFAQVSREENLLHPPGFEPRTIQTVMSPYTDYTIPAHSECPSARNTL